ncbi:elongator complex protein 5 [Panulirus ornatus]|uniref:elongator complex protein 5 n=1 Tax=Panulirus ornatus TaxID=150431 RepID=UPI003A8AA80F
MSKSALGRIIKRTEVPIPRMVLMTDTAEVCGRGLLYALVRSHLCCGTDVFYLTTSHSPGYIKDFVKDEDTPGKVEFLDGASDPCGWDENKTALSLNEPLHDIFKNRYSSAAIRKGKATFVVDRLEDVTHHQDSSQLVRGLHALSAEDYVEQLIVFCGRDIVAESMLSAVCHIARATVHLMPTKPCSCRVVLRKPSGKVIKAHEEFSLTSELQVQDIHPVHVKEVPCVAESSDTDAILAAQTTFNLSLTDDQRIEKNKLLLPHTRVQSLGGQILYTPDDADDWDEDDPDDDLDI